MIDIEAAKLQFEKDLGESVNLFELKNKYLGRKNGILTEALKNLSQLSIAEKQQFGPVLNQLRVFIETKMAEKENSPGGQSQDIDFSIPPLRTHHGHVHPLTKTQEELEQIFGALGFTVELGPEIETDWYNFTALNFPEGHPARDMHDTFYASDPNQERAKKESRPGEKLLLRTHTSPMQVRYMQTHKPPFAIIVPGACYRNEATDSTHEHTFSQMEGLVVGENINFNNMVWTLNFALKKFFGDKIKTKLLPAFFPFVEPGAELAISSPKFKDGKWTELLGCGMVHQNVFEAAGYERGKYQGFAFGFGISRFSIMKFGIPDIRLLSESNLQFLNQF